MSFASAERADNFNYTDIYDETVLKYRNGASYEELKKECFKLEESIEYSQNKFSVQKKTLIYSGIALMFSSLSLFVKVIDLATSVFFLACFVFCAAGLLFLIVTYLKSLKDESFAILEQRKQKAQRDALRYLISENARNI